MCRIIKDKWSRKDKPSYNVLLQEVYEFLVIYLFERNCF